LFIATVQNLGVVCPYGRGNREGGMKWRIVVELIGADGTIGVHEVGGGDAPDEYSPRTIGLTLAEGKQILALVQFK
jgi:hypothetical protein